MDKVNFGSKKVKKGDKPELVSKIFSSVSNKYDLMNDAMSFLLFLIKNIILKLRHYMIQVEKK